MDNSERKAAVAAYKEREVVGGVYAVRCQPTGQLWLGRAPDLSTIWTRLKFELGMGNFRQRNLQAAWAAHGADAFGFEEVERFGDDAPVTDQAGRERVAHWAETLGGEVI